MQGICIFSTVISDSPDLQHPELFKRSIQHPVFTVPFSFSLHSLALIPHSSFLIPHSSFLIPHSSFLIPHSSFLIPHSSFLIPHSSFLIPHSSFLTPHSSLLIPHSSFLTPHSSPLTSHLFLIMIQMIIGAPNSALTVLMGKVYVGI